MRRLRTRFLRDQHGTTAIEYGLIAAGVALAIVAVMIAVGGDVKELFGKLGTEMHRVNQNGEADGD